jgi:glyoxylase-like metal-dependent hydrolase (beta-lactamase superfamily II)
MLNIISLPLGPLQTNCYLIACETNKEAMVIDPAWAGDIIQLKAREAGWHIAQIVLTHSHFDHVAGLAALQVASGAPVSIHEDAIPMLELAAASAARWGIHIEQPEVPEERLTEGQVLEVGSVLLKVLYTPGHAPGHICLYAEDEGVLFDGDVLFQGSIGRTDLPGGDYARLLQSIHEELLVLPDETRVYPGHGNPTTIGAERLRNPFLQDHR